MTKTLRIHRLAEDELADAASWYEARQKGLGISLLDLIDKAVDAITTGALPTSPITGVRAERARRVLLPRYPYSIVLYERENEIFDCRFCSQQPAAGLLAFTKVLVTAQ